jgi:hypothetical protein
MIDVKVTTLGDREMAARFMRADSGIRTALREELAIIGDEIVSRAQAAAPKRTGKMASKIVWYFGREFMRGRKGNRHAKVVEYAKDPRIFFAARPRGRVAHLVERGVNATFQQSPGPRGGKFPKVERAYTRSLAIPPRPFFMPAVASVGGAGGVGLRLQAALNDLARTT